MAASPYTYTPLGSEHVEHPISRSSKPRSVRSYLALSLALVLGACLAYTVTPSESVESLQAQLTALSQKLASSSSHSAISADSRLCNDPFDAPGQLESVVGEPDLNLWRPWDKSCAPSTLLTSLRNGDELPWLQDKTVAIIGDSIDRDHVEYFCELSRGNMEWIWENTPLSPEYTFSPGDSKTYNESDNGQSTGGGQQSRPRICRVEKYNFTLVYAFHYGLSDGTEVERAMPHFYPPFRFQDRLDNILIPILRSLSRYPPAMVEFSTGSWDLQHWSLADREVDGDRLSPLSAERADWYRERFGRALRYVEDAFPATGKREETTLLLREMQHTKLSDIVPPPRVHALRRMQEWILEKESRQTGRWKLDPIGQILLGMEHQFRDAVHPNLYPAGKVWGDIMLHNLKRHVESLQI